MQLVANSEGPQQKRSRAPSRPFPSVGLAAALRIPQAISDSNAGRPMSRLLLADALKLSPGSSLFRDLLSGSARYGLTLGNYVSEVISLEPIGVSITRPTSTGERLDAIRSAMKTIPLFKQLLDHFNNAKLPSTDFLANTLERQYGIDAAWSSEASKVFVETARFVGVVRDVSGTPYVMMDSGSLPIPATEASGSAPDDNSDSDEEASGGTTPAPARQLSAALQDVVQKRQFFVAHGSDREALSQLQSMLKDLGIPFVTAIDEANAGRPISQKVAELMKESSGGLFIFSGDEEVSNPKDGRIEKRPRMNVVFELGAASLLYNQRIVIFKEKDVMFPSDFRDLGYIEYERGKLAGTSLQLLKELIKLGAVQLLPGGV
jgi:predicted nucleotide-binding protein